MEISIENNTIQLTYQIPFNGKLMKYTKKETFRDSLSKNQTANKLIKSAALFMLKKYLKHRIEAYKRIKQPEKLDIAIKFMKVADVAHAMSDKFFFDFTQKNDWTVIAPVRRNCWSSIIPELLDFIKENYKIFNNK